MKSFALLMGAVAVSSAVVGCGSCVGQKEYLNTMMVDEATANVLAYVPPAATSNESAVSPGGVVLATELWLDSPGDAAIAGPSSRAALGYSSDVRRQIDSLTREMRLLESRAGIKGAPTRAALDPKLRVFNSAIDQLESRLSDSDSLSNQLEADVALATAQQAVREAHDVVNITRGLGENRSGT